MGFEPRDRPRGRGGAQSPPPGPAIISIRRWSASAREPRLAIDHLRFHHFVRRRWPCVSARSRCRGTKRRPCHVLDVAW